MEQTKVASVQDGTIIDTQGRVLERAGNAIMTVGDIVWTDGVIAYGHTTRGFQPFVPEVIPAGTIPLFGSMYNEFIHAVYDETKGEIVRYDAKTPSPFMVNSHNDFSLSGDILGGDYDFDADMSDDGDVYVISGGEWAYDYDGYKPNPIGKEESFAFTITRNITNTMKSDARPYSPDHNYTSTSTQVIGGDSRKTGFYDFELEEKSGKGETKSTAFIWKNDKKINDFSNIFKKASKDMFERLSLEFPGFHRDNVECSMTRPRINGKGDTNYFLTVRMNGFLLIPFDLYEENITETIDKGIYYYDARPSGEYWKGEEIYWTARKKSWQHWTIDDVEFVLAGEGNGVLSIHAYDEIFVDENGDETILKRAITYGTNKRNWNELTDKEKDGSFVFAGKMTEAYKITVDSYSEEWSRGGALDQYHLDSSTQSEQTSKLERNTSQDNCYAENIRRFRNSYEEFADRDKMRFMAQDGFRFDYDGNLYKGDTKIYSFKGDFEWVPKMVTEIEGGYLIGIVDKYTSGRPPIYKLIEIKGGKERELEDTTWMNTRLRHMKNIEKWINGRREK